MNPFRHFIITRFNVRENPDDPTIITDPHWLEQRFSLFEQFCMPSVRAQTNQAFTWIVFFDTATPAAFRRRIDRYAEWPVFHPVFSSAMSKDTVVQTLEGLLPSPPGHLITTRLDNDDAIHREFVELVQNCFRGQQREVINLTTGYVWHNGKVYLHRDKSNPFASMIESREDFITIWARPHTRLDEVAPLRQLPEPPAWLQVVHGGNLSNRVRGVRQHRTALRSHFAIDSGWLTIPEHRLFLWFDKTCCTPVRSAREILIRLARATIRNGMSRSK